jgi:D-alanyl-D-alanine dipeptidase
MRCELLHEHPDFQRLSSINGIEIDLRYVGENNFFGVDLYGELDCAWLHKEAASALNAAAAWLDQHHPGYKIRVYDALRPHRVQVMLWQHLEGTPLRTYVADPAIGSIHSFGMAVDVTVIDPAGNPLDMGSGFDELNEKSHPNLETEMLASGKITAAQVANREILRQAMLQNGFYGIRSEWWHFNCNDPVLVRANYLRIE